MNTDHTETRRATTESRTAPNDPTPGDHRDARGASSAPRDIEAGGANSAPGDNIEARSANPAPGDNIEARSANPAPGDNNEARSASPAPGNNNEARGATSALGDNEAHGANPAPGNAIDAPGTTDSASSTDREARTAAHLTPTDAHLNTSGDIPNSDHAAPSTGTRDASTAEAVGGDRAHDNTTAATPNGKSTAAHDEPIPLFTEAEIERLRTEWRTVQGSFIDNPRDAVSRADNLVANTIDHLTAAYSEHRRGLTTRWSQDPDTEDLRNTLRAYRTFFNQLLP